MIPSVSLLDGTQLASVWAFLIGAVVLAWMAFARLCRHKPLIADFIVGFMRSLLGSRRRRRGQ
jgi:hypothetical protein